MVRRTALLAATLGVVCGMLAAPLPARAAADPVVEEALPDPALEARAMGLAREIRCVVCENEPVSNSSAEIAVDMRNAIRERVAGGDSDDAVRAYFASRYGEFVLLRPRLSATTIALWAAPFVLLLLGGLVVLARARRSAPADIAAAAVPAEDEAAARAALARLQADPQTRD